MGAFWERQAWWGGSMEALDAATTNYRGDPDEYKHRRFDLWVCLIPMVPIHFESLWCPQPQECSADSCWVREVGSIEVRVAVDMGDTECSNCHGRGRIHNVGMGPPHPSECTWCALPCPECQEVCERCLGRGRVQDLNYMTLRPIPGQTTKCPDCEGSGLPSGSDRVGVPESGMFDDTAPE